VGVARRSRRAKTGERGSGSRRRTRAFLPASLSKLAYSPCMPISTQPATSNHAADPHWVPIVSFLAVGVLYLAIPPRLSPGPNWLLLAVVLSLVVAGIHLRKGGYELSLERLRLALSGVITLALVWSLGKLIAGLSAHRDTPAELFRSAAALWAANVLVFASWYWKLDAGGPHKRAMRGAHTDGAFFFPQMSADMKDWSNRPWQPGFVDYLFLAFNTSTAFSPTDVAPLTPWAKLLMMAQSIISIGTITILCARAVNLL
jgi:hypothetical protein